MFYTFKYRGHYIHGRTPDRHSEEEVEWQDAATFDVHPAQSVHAAKCQIGRKVNREQAIQGGANDG